LNSKSKIGINTAALTARTASPTDLGGLNRMTWVDNRNVLSLMSLRDYTYSNVVLHTVPSDLVQANRASRHGGSAIHQPDIAELET